MKKKWLWISLIVVFLLFLFFFLFQLFFQIKEDNSFLIFTNKFTTEVYSDVKVSSFVSVPNGKLLEDPIIDTSTIGEKQVKFLYLNQNQKKLYGTLKIKVEDTTKPLVWLGNSYTVTKGNDKSLTDMIMCADNYDKKPVCTVEGTYDMNQVGTYSLVFQAVDQSKNTTRIPFTLSVKEKSKSSSTPKGKELQEVINNHKTENSMIGIDVSKWQGEIDWNQVKESGVEFVMIRIGSQAGIGKESVLDPYFEENLKGAKEVGLSVGIYYYSYAKTKEEAKEQAKWVLEQLQDRKLELPIVFDWESWSYFNQLEISIHDLNFIANQFLEIIQQNGYQGMLYSSKNYLDRIWNVDNYPVWLAHYTSKTNYSGNYKMWQLTNVGKVPGISGFVDINVMYQ